MENTIQGTNWKNPRLRFVAYFDIMGFKELVARNTHEKVIEKLKILKDHLKELEEINHDKILKSYKAHTSETKSITFSDSIIFFSKGNSFADAMKVIIDSILLLVVAFDNQIPIKGVLSYGKITVNFEDSLFFGQPIIDAYLLEQELQLYTGVLDHHFEAKLNELMSDHEYEFLKEMVTKTKINLKSGIVTHMVVKPTYFVNAEEVVNNAEKLYLSASGNSRKYVDNTLVFLNTLLKEERKRIKT